MFKLNVSSFNRISILHCLVWYVILKEKSPDQAKSKVAAYIKMIHYKIAWEVFSVNLNIKILLYF
jgi:hypothetical protein